MPGHDGEPIERLPFAVPDIARIHGLTVAALMLTVIATLVHLHRSDAPAAEQWRGRLVLLCLLLQAGVGYVQYFTGVPVVLVGIHIAGATLTWIAVTWFHMDLSPEPDDLVDASEDHPADHPILVS